jgi:hypothetical protein
MTLEERVEQLERKLELLRNYIADKYEKKPSTRRLWSKEEQDFLREKYRQGPTSLCRLWNNQFGHDRTVDSIRKKGERIGILWPQ